MEAFDLLEDSAAPPRPEETESPLRLTVIDREGVRHVLEALSGWRAMEVIRDWGVPIKAECGGACACGTCHVYVDESWLSELFPATPEEEDQLDTLSGVQPNSRLACQILMRPDLDGLTLRLAPGSEP